MGEHMTVEQIRADEVNAGDRIWYAGAWRSVELADLKLAAEGSAAQIVHLALERLQIPQDKTVLRALEEAA